MGYSDIPTWIVRRAPIDWALELHAGMSLPFAWGPFSIPPIAAGTLSLFELAYVKFLTDPLEANTYDLMRAVFIALNREDAHALCQHDRAFHEDMEKDFDLEDTSTWSRLDIAAMSLFTKVAARPELFAQDSRLKLWRWLDVSFEGYRMMHGGSSGAASEWLYGLDSLACYVRLAGMVTNESVFNITWRMPVALVSQMTAANAQATSLEVKVYREPDHKQIDRLRIYIKETEDKGEMLYWQKAYPERYDLSDVQISNGGDKLVLAFAQLRNEVMGLDRKEREARSAEIIEREGVS